MKIVLWKGGDAPERVGRSNNAGNYPAFPMRLPDKEARDLVKAHPGLYELAEGAHAKELLEDEDFQKKLAMTDMGGGSASLDDHPAVRDAAAMTEAQIEADKHRDVNAPDPAMVVEAPTPTARATRGDETPAATTRAERAAERQEAKP